MYCTLQFNMSFYMTYLARWPDYFHVAEAPGNRIMGYSTLSLSLSLSLLTSLILFLKSLAIIEMEGSFRLDVILFTV